MIWSELQQIALDQQKNVNRQEPYRKRHYLILRSVNFELFEHFMECLVVTSFLLCSLKHMMGVRMTRRLVANPSDIFCRNNSQIVMESSTSVIDDAFNPTRSVIMESALLMGLFGKGASSLTSTGVLPPGPM
jgi:hypothetical protein